MAINLKTEDGLEISFGTVDEFMEFKKRMDEEEDSKETESSSDETASEPKSLGQDANGEDLYVGDLVTGSEDNEYYYTDSTVDMEVLGEGSSIMNEEANIRVRIIGESDTYGVDSSKFIKLSDASEKDLDEETEFKVGDKVRVVRNRARHDVEAGEVREITRVDSEEPKYNLSKYSCGSWAYTEDIELVEEEQKDIEYGDIVYVKESITDSYGDTVEPGTYYRVGILDGRLLVSGVLVEHESQLDNLVLVAKNEDILI